MRKTAPAARGVLLEECDSARARVGGGGAAGLDAEMRGNYPFGGECES